MKKIFIISLIVCNYFIAQSQNVGIGTIAPAGKLHIVGSADASQLIIDANSTQSNTNPLIRLRNAAGTDLLHINTDNISNTFIGLNAGKNNSAANGGTDNTFIGSNAGFSNTTGIGNTASGFQALTHNTSGSVNTSTGFLTLAGNTTGYDNTATGSYALNINSTGIGNTANGSFALSFNTSGIFNVAVGEYTMNANNGSYNTAIGNNALSRTTNSQYNTALGYKAGANYDNGYNNVFLGANVDVNGTGYYNVIAIGQGTVCTGSSQVTIGNGATGVYRAYANWSNISDGRFKRNVQENVPGLEFINELHPVTYNLKATELDAFLHKDIKQPAQLYNKRTDVLNSNKTESQSNDAAAEAVYNKSLKEKETNVYTGFVAQEVEATAKKIGFNFSGIDAPKNANDVYSLRYADFVVPLVKAVQELSLKDDQLKKENELLKTESTTQKNINADLQRQIDELKALIKK